MKFSTLAAAALPAAAAIMYLITGDVASAEAAGGSLCITCWDVWG